MDGTRDLDPGLEHDPAEGSHVEDGVVEHPTADDFGHARSLPADRTWFKRAVFYEVLVRAFYDSNADGSGDLRGLIERLDYLQWLGVDCLWLPPFYDSPLRDGGYDIRDFYKVLPEFGTVDDFVALLDAAHKRGHPGDHRPGHEPHLRPAPVVPGVAARPRRARTATSTSGATPATSTPTPGSSSSTPRSRTGRSTRCAGSSTGTGSSPTSPTSTTTTRPCRTRCSTSLRFWLDLGIDGFRLDAVPYLFEREGTNCENLPETHAFLKRCPQGHRRRVPRPGAAGRGEPVAGRRRRVLRRPAAPAATNATWRSTSR